MICRAFLRLQMMPFFYEPNGNLINNKIINTAIKINREDINKFFQIMDLLYKLVLLDINHQIIDHY